jgi:hypothetical protein
MEYYISVEFVSLIIQQYSMYLNQAYNLLHYLNQKTSWGSLWLGFPTCFCFCKSQKPTKGPKSQSCFCLKAVFALVQNWKQVPCFQLLLDQIFTHLPLVMIGTGLFFFSSIRVRIGKEKSWPPLAHAWLRGSASSPLRRAPSPLLPMWAAAEEQSRTTLASRGAADMWRSLLARL